jgi:hypothetical protein
MGGGSSWNRSDYHNWDEETVGAQNGFYHAQRYNGNVTNDLNRVYQLLGYEQDRIQTRAFQEELTYLLRKQDIEWSIFQEEVKKAQATLIGNYYTNRITAELGNLRDIVNET